MKVLLTKDVKGLGKAGDVKEVKDGYGQNFLIRNNLAKAATDGVVKQQQAQAKKEAEIQAQALDALKETAKKLEGTSFTITKKVGANGSLFGALTKEEIAETVEKAGFEIDKKAVEIDHAIKQTGLFEISLKLGHGLHPKIKVEVVGE